ncbi:MAG: hypothetical protein EOP83_06885 [Verrucomicrobiaceae bacterium]|nr:MAG: hypothetical protein EOP83_06885 [Verrucomicrobiaceae bacterium]
MHVLLDLIGFFLFVVLLWNELGEGVIWFYWTLYIKNKTVFTARKHGVDEITRIRGLKKTLTYFEFLPDIEEWCRENLRGRYGCVPAKDRVRCRRIWFADPNDAFAFRLRWL